MNNRLTIIISLLLPLTISCASIKIGLFRGVMKVMGGNIYKARFIALNDPEFITANEADYLRDEEEVIGISFNGIAKAYPLTMSFHHHIFNDEIGGKRVLVTFCPLTHTAMIFDPIVDGKRALKFTVDGLMESNMIMVDDSTRSHWVQITGEVIRGRMAETRLGLLFGLHTTWGVWKKLYPNTLVLSGDTGFDYDYSRFPFQEKYLKYKRSSRFFFKVSHQDGRYHPKEIILGVEIGDVHKAYPFSALRGQGVLNDTVARIPIAVFFDRKSQTIAAFLRQFNGVVLEFRVEEDSSGVTIRDSIYNSAWDFEGKAYDGPCNGMPLQPVASFKAFWFAWAAFHPGTRVYTGE